MEIQDITISVCRRSINPTLLIRVPLQYEKESEALVSIAGSLLTTKDDKVIAHLSEIQTIQDRRFELFFKVKSRLKHKETYITELEAVLSLKAIEHIELQREVMNGDVSFTLQFDVKYLVNYDVFADISIESLKKLENIPFTTLRVERNRRDKVIPQSIWTKDYAPHLGIGNFLLVELQIPDNKQVPELWKNLYNQLANNLKEMEKNLRDGNWQSTMSAARKFYENAKFGDDKPGSKKYKSAFDTLLAEDSHSLEGIKDFYDGIWKFFEFLSKYIHDKDKSANLVPSPSPQKEDAYLAFSLAMGLLNFIGKKISKG